MYTLKITDENTVVTTVKESIVERSNYVDKIQIVTSKMYREQIDMSDTTVYMKYKLPVSDKIKMTQLIIHITPLVQFDKYEPSELFTEIDQRLLAMEGMIKDLNAQNKATYEGMVKDIRLNTENRKITLTDRNGEDTGNGIVVKDLSAMVAEDMTGKDPDGTQDGVVHLDQVVDLDKLLK